MKKTLRILLVVATMLLPLTTKAQNDSMLVNIAVNNPVMGTTTPAPGAHYFHVGDTCHVVATANEGYVLTGWDIQWSFMGTVLMDTTVDLPMADVFDLVGMINGGDGWVVQIGHNWYSFSVTANFVAASEYVPDSMVVNVAVNNATMGTTVPAPGAHYFYEGDTVSVVAVANDGYHLTGWTVQGYAAGNAFLDTTVNIAVPDVFEIIAFVTGQEWVVAPGYGNFSFNVTANFIEASQYIPDSMTVNVAVNNPLMGMTFPGTGTHKFAEGDTCHVVALANEGYHLTGWTVQVSFAGETYIDTTVDIAVHDAFDLMILIEELRSAGDMSTFELLHMLAQPIGEWLVSPLYAQATLNLTANFAVGAPTSTHITYAVNDTTMGTTTPAPGDYSLHVGDEVTAEAIANDGYMLKAWIMEYTYYIAWMDWDVAVISDTIHFDDPNFSNPVRFLGVMQQLLDTLPTAGIYITAVFEPLQHTVTLSSADETMGSVSPAGASTVAHGQTFTATATAESGYHFLGWADATTDMPITYANPYTFIVTEDVSLKALFAEGGYYTVNVNWDYMMGSVSFPMHLVFEGDQISLMASPYDGYRFVNWTATDGTVLCSDTIYTIIVTSDTTLNANFESVTGIDNIEGADFEVYSVDNRIIVKGAEGMPVSLFDITGRLLGEFGIQNSELRIEVPAAGVYLVKVGNAAARRVVVR